ncbi:hypothetical protein E3T54_02935 [Cryobacterium sp. Sr8]|uniref:phage tail tube protein n=1 Tax=Cryobacterium sp. Sr8 TaxID=1259203 RepID=UPI00106B684F|nr:phage tail tube protein [Cryobacterium sp. Sr8]TFD80712.1 hypothetical protein E3T54_02935 [Cryobacterium sp. Sr8]
MTTQLDSSIGLKKETTFGAAVVVDKFYEFTEEDFAWVPTFAQGAGQRFGQRVAAADRRVLVKEESNGSLTVEAVTKGLGALLEAALGTATSTIIGTGPGYQQVFTPTADDYLPSYTVQKGVPILGGAVSPQTFAGCVCSGFELSGANGAIPTFQFNFLGKSVDTVAAYAAASYPANNQLLSFVNGSITIGGTVTAPTASALASGGTAAGNIRDFALTWDNGLDENGFDYGGAGKRSRKPALGLRSGTGTITAEYDSNVLRDAYLAQTNLALVLTFASTVAISAGVFPTIQITIPNIRLEGELPKAAAGDVITQAIGFTVLDNRTAAHPIYVAIVTPETAI